MCVCVCVGSGTMVTLGLSEKFPDLCPEQSGFVRACLLLGGYVFKPVPGGTLMTIVVQVRQKERESIALHYAALHYMGLCTSDKQ